MKSIKDQLWIISFALVLMFCTLVFFGVRVCGEQPTIYIFREYHGESMQGPCLIVDYTIGGYATSAIFYDYELGAYEKFMAYLEQEGRVIR